MNLRRNKHLVSVVVGATVLAGSVQAASVQTNFSPDAKVNVLRQYNLDDMTLMTEVTWHPAPYSTSDPYSVIDGGHRFAYPEQVASGYVEIKLAAPVSISSINTMFAPYDPLNMEYRLLGSLTGAFDGPNAVLVDWTAVTGSEAVVRVDQLSANPSVQYLRLEYKNPGQTWFQIHEIMAFAANPATISLGGGYNIMGETTMGSIVASGGWYSDNDNYNDRDPVHLFDMDPTTYLGTPNGTGDESFFIKDLGASYRLTGAAYAFHKSEKWASGFTIEVTNDKDWETATWITLDLVGDTTASAGTLLFDPTDARYIRVSTTENRWQWMDSLEFYAVPVPEPMTMSLLALGGLAVLRRRR